MDDCHPAFTGQIHKLIPVGRAFEQVKTDTQIVDDLKAHRTHICGTIIRREIETFQGKLGGVAQDAKVILSSVTKHDGDLIAMLQIQTLFEIPYNEYDAHVHPNSWGDGLGAGKKQMPYNTAATNIEKFVRDNPDALNIFPAGNQNQNMDEKAPTGTQKPAIGPQASAKNCLTVGASESTGVVTPVKKNIMDGLDPDQVCPHGRRGPITEGRIKLDVVAPGFNIFSVHSRHREAAKYSAPTATNKAYPDVCWKARSVPSHPTPLVSGCAAILRQILQSKGCQNPSTALLKAVIINGAEKLPDIDIAAQGFGRINLQSSVAMLQYPPVTPQDNSGSAPLSSQGGTLIGPPSKQDDTFSFTLSPPSPPYHPSETTSRDNNALALKKTLVYNYLPGGAIQNDVNLAVINSDKSITKHGGISKTEIDKQNTVEQVIWYPVPTPGEEPLTVRVTAQKIFPGSEQHFVLAWSTAAPYTGVKKGF